LLQRALEGGRRGVDGARVVSVVKALADRMRNARAALGASASDAEIVAGAGALYLGIDRGVLDRLRRERAGHEVALPLIIMADIIGRGVPRDTASRIILSLNEARITDADYMMLRQSILLDIGSGASPTTAAVTRAHGILLVHPAVKPPEQ